MKQIGRCMVLLLGVFLVCTMVFSGSAFSQVIELRYASQNPQGHPYSIADQNWITKIEKETNGRVKIKPYWGGSLISSREGTSELAKGVADIAFIYPIYEKAGVDLTKLLLGCFKGTQGPEANIKIFWELYDKFPEFRKEYEGRMKPLVINASTATPLMTTDKPVKTLADIKGMRIKTVAEVMTALKDFGAEGVVIPMVETYEQLQKGIIKGVFAAHETYKSMKFSEVIKYETVNFTTPRGPYVSRAMNLDSWKKLPPDIQKIIEASRIWWEQETLKELAKQEAAGEELAKKASVQFVQMDSADVAKFDEAYEKDNIKAAQELDKKGLPATKFYNEARRLVKQASVQKK